VTGAGRAEWGPHLIVGKLVTLRRFEREDVPHVRGWLEDPELRVQIGATGPMGEGEALEWFRRADSDVARRWFVVQENEGDTVVGEAGLLRIFPEWRTTDMSVILGDRDSRGKGYGTEAGSLLLDLAFGRMGLHRVAVGVVGFHEAALRFWESLGFAREGVQRDGYLVGDEFHDFVMMSILEHEWRERTSPLVY